MAACPKDEFKKKIMLITDLGSVKKYFEVPDPYHGGPEDFELVIDILESCRDGLKKLLDAPEEK